MTPRDVLSALVSALFFGLAFIAIKIGVHETTPLLLTALRFAFAAFPAVLFVKPPKAPFGLTMLYGLTIGVGQFGVLFIAIGRGMPVGLASLVIQLQVFVTIFLAWALLREKPRPAQLIGAGIALLGMAAIGSERLAGASLGPFLLVLVAALFWGVGNIVGKLAGRIDMYAFVAWAALAAPAPLFLLSLIFEGGAPLAALLHPSLALILCVALLAYGATVISYGLWARLLAAHSAAEVAPFALLIPVIGMVSGWLVFGEPLSAIELIGAALVMAGLIFNVFGDRLFARRVETA
ncbi:MAG TPA: EamA family transporter [Roseiarcus sp.]|nr:EamA family transporter [Roseiarcus sp.]